MKLITKTILNYLLVSIPLILFAGFFSYYLIKHELRDGVDETIFKDNKQIENSLKDYPVAGIKYLSHDSLSFVKASSVSIKQITYLDTSVFDRNENEFVNYRSIRNSVSVNGINYLIVISKTTLEEEELMEGLFSSFALVILFLVVAFFIMNWLLSKKLWKPFYNTISKLGEYDVNKNTQLSFDAHNVTEFNELNHALNNMINKINKDYLHQKEFTENASHEMQTPLAIIKANVSALLQSENHNELEMNELMSIENTIKKLSSLNKTLLLLAKIENNQFQKNENVCLKTVINTIINQYVDIIEIKKIKIIPTFNDDLYILMNPLLAEILIRNLIQNAIKYTDINGIINIIVNKKDFSIANVGKPLTIKEDDLFQRFKKDSESVESLGLGLSIVKSIIDLYGFKIDYKHLNSFHTFTIHSF